MCGIAGAIDDARDQSWWDDSLRAMSAVLSHRGPDDHGFWVDPRAGVGFAHRRLSILDLSPEGRQPMISHGGRYVIAYNGEMYNYRALREELDGSSARPWRGRSDTEVMLAAIEEWGLDAAVRRFNGMFAFALWDREERSLALVRDRVGIKPLYHGRVGRSYVFASELRAIRNHPEFEADIDRDALAAYLRHNYVPAPSSIYRGIRKLLPGRILRVAPDGTARESTFWALEERLRAARDAPFAGDEHEAVEELERLLFDAVQHRTVSDVPLGAFLSGGIDSSLVVALLQASADRPVKTFTIGFSEAAFDESPHAREIARHLGTDHHERIVTPEDALEVIPRIPRIWDEPFADSSQVPTFLVSELARRDVTVSLSGDGGDELFGGYTRYPLCRELWSRIDRIPRLARAAAASVLRSTPGPVLDVGLAWTRRWIRKYGTDGRPSDKVAKFADLLELDDPRHLYLGLVSHWREPTAIVAGSRERSAVLDRWEELAPGSTLTETMMAVDTLTYLPDDILVKVDRASMHVSLEARVPLLDHRVIEFVWGLPERFKVRDGSGKWLLRRVLDRHVPRSLVERPKMGFGVPLGEWLRGPLRAWAEELLDARRLREDGLFDPEPIRDRWEQHCRGKGNFHYWLWDVLMFQTWKEAA